MSQRQRSEPGNVPVELASFVGRARELAEVKRLLAAARVVTLTGPGGIGKSRLALRAAHQLGRFFRDGVWLAELAELDGPDLVPVALARSLGVYDRPEAASRTRWWITCGTVGRFWFLITASICWRRAGSW